MFYQFLFYYRHTHTHTATPEHGPVITGGKARYQIGDMVRLNCTSGRSKPAAHLQWFINGEQAEASLTRQYETLVTGREGKYCSEVKARGRRRWNVCHHRHHNRRRRRLL